MGCLGVATTAYLAFVGAGGALVGQLFDCVPCARIAPRAASVFDEAPEALYTWRPSSCALAFP